MHLKNNICPCINNFLVTKGGPVEKVGNHCPKQFYINKVLALETFISFAFITNQTSKDSFVLVTVEYTHNTLTSSTTSLSPFQYTSEYQPLLFPDLEVETSCSWASARAYLPK